MLDKQVLEGFIGQLLRGGDGEAIGSIVGVVTGDGDTTRWVTIRMDDTGERLVPAVGATLDGEDVRVPWDRAAVEAAPASTLTWDRPDAEAELLDHYGIIDLTSAGLDRSHVDLSVSPQAAEAEAAPEQEGHHRRADADIQRAVMGPV
jgi:hypothetical protein